MVGTHVNGSTLQLTSQITIGGVGEFASIGANIPVIKTMARPEGFEPPTF